MDITNEQLEELQKKYNEEQIKAIISPMPLTIIAGPGSGKTTTIVEKIIQTVKNKEDLKRTLIITFTNEAARNIIYRLKAKFFQNEDGEEINWRNYYIGTFHAIFFKFLYENYEYVKNDLGFQKNLKILEPSEDLKIFSKIAYKAYNPTDKMTKKETDEVFYNIHSLTIKDFYYKILNEMNKAPETLKELNEKVMAHTYCSDIENRDKFSQIMRDFIEYKKEEGFLNFNDILLYTYFLGHNIPEFREMLSKKFKNIFIDEYQDTNPVQDKLIKLIKSNNDCEVGDAYQSIYMFLNADIKNIMNLLKEEDRNVVQLTKNYRSSPNIVEFTNDITTLFAEQIPNFIHCTSENKEVKNLQIEVKEGVFQEFKILNHIQKSLRNGIKPSEIAIISRANFETMKMEKLLLENKIPFIKLSGKSFYERKEITAIIDLLKILIKKFNIINFENVAEFMPGLGIKSIEKVADAYLNRKNRRQSLASVIEDNFKKNAKLQTVKELLFDHSSLDYYTFYEIFTNKQLNMYNQLIENGSTTSAKKEIRNNIESFLNEIRPIINSDNLTELEDFLSVVSLDKKEKDEHQRENSIVITTAHSAKGLEWNNCYILNAEDGKFPSEKSMSFDEQIEEEKRLFYVAVSRAKEFLMITSANDINQFVYPFIQNKYISHERVEKQNDFMMF